MISLFRRHLQGRFLRYIIYVAALLLLFPTAITVFFQWFDAGDWVVKVNGHTADIQEYNQRVYELNHQLVRQFGQKAASKFPEKDLKKLAIDSLIVQKLVDSVSQDLHLALSPAYISQQLLNMVDKEFIGSDGTINLNLIAQMRGMTLKQFEGQLNSELKGQVARVLTIGSVYLPAFFLKNKFIEDYAERNYRIASFSLDKVIDKEKMTAISDKDAKAFFVKENKKNKRYWSPEVRAGFVVTFDPQTYGAKVAEKQARRYYNENKYKEFVADPTKVQVRRILLKFDDKTKGQVQVKISQLREELVKNSNLFAQKARELSEDSASKKKGGLLDFLARGEGDQKVEQAVFRLQKDGDISPVIGSKDGFELLQRVAKKGQVFKPFDQVRSSIEQSLRAKQFARIFPLDVRRALTQENKVVALDELAKRRHGKKEPILFSPRGTQPYMAKLFSLKKGSGGNLFDGKKGLVVFVTDIKKSSQPKFESVKNDVKGNMYEERAQKVMKALFEEGEKLPDKGSFEQFAKKHGASIETTGWINKKSLQNIESLSAKLGGEMKRIFVATKIGSIIPFSTKTGGSLVYLESIKPFDEKAFGLNKDEVMAQVFMDQKMVVEQGFIASLFKNAKIKVNDKIIK